MKERDGGVDLSHFRRPTAIETRRPASAANRYSESTKQGNICTTKELWPFLLIYKNSTTRTPPPIYPRPSVPKRTLPSSRDPWL